MCYLLIGKREVENDGAGAIGAVHVTLRKTTLGMTAGQNKGQFPMSTTGQTAVADAIPYHLLDPAVIENPYPFYGALLQHAPVYRVPGTEVYLVSSWHLVHEVLKNQADYSANLTGILIRGDDGEPELFDLSQFGGTVDAIANADEPIHAVHRKLVLPQLTARRVAGMEEEVRSWVAHRVRGLVRYGGGDCVGDLANAIPVMVMARLVGLPVSDVDRLLQWAFSGGDILAGTVNLERMIELGVATREMSAYLAQHLRIAMDAADGGDADCVADELARGIENGVISEAEAVAIMVVLVGAAGESTSSLVGSAIRLLAEDRQLQARLRTEPGLIEGFVEEVVRLESPFRGHYRVVLNDTELGGITLPAGSRVCRFEKPLEAGARTRTARARPRSTHAWKST